MWIQHLTSKILRPHWVSYNLVIHVSKFSMSQNCLSNGRKIRTIPAVYALLMTVTPITIKTYCLHSRLKMWHLFCNEITIDYTPCSPRITSTQKALAFIRPTHKISSNLPPNVKDIRRQDSDWNWFVDVRLNEEHRQTPGLLYASPLPFLNVKHS